jgi:hypothetical protein
MRRKQVCRFVAIALAMTAQAGFVWAQTATGRALFAYPLQGQTSEQESADRAACHDWAVVQSGFDPTPIYAAQQADIPIKNTVLTTSNGCFPSYEKPCFPKGGIGGAQGKAGIQRINDLYDAYLRAGQVCLEARGYQVSR